MPDNSHTSISTADVLAIDANVALSTGPASFGVTAQGFMAKPFARLLAEKLALARALFGDEVDLTSGSVIRKLLEISALEDARTWTSLAAMYANCFVVSATGNALSQLGEELGIPRPFLQAQGTIKLTLTGALPASYTALTIQRGTRLLTAGGHHVATDETVVLSPTSKERLVAIIAFYPGPDGNLDPTAAAADGTFPQKIDRWNLQDQKIEDLVHAEAAAGGQLVSIVHTTPLTGGEVQWSDVRYRQLLLQAPRSLWSVDGIRIAVSLVPGVRQVQIRDGWGGLDIYQSIFGNFNFIERVFNSERDLASPYYFSILVAPTLAAIWDGPDGLRTSVESAIEDLRPLGIFPQVQQADEIGIGVRANLVVRGLPIPTGPRQVVNASAAATALKDRLLLRLRQYIDNLSFGEPVRAAEATWALMSEPGIADVQQLTLLRFPPGLSTEDFGALGPGPYTEPYDCGQNVAFQVNQIPVFVDDASGLTII